MEGIIRHPETLAVVRTFELHQGVLHAEVGQRQRTKNPQRTYRSYGCPINMNCHIYCLRC